MPETMTAMPGATELHTRFLFPFLFQSGAIREVAKDLEEVRISLKKQTVALWERAEPEDIYREELLDHALEYFFAGQGEGRCAYYRLDSAVANQWFGRLQVQSSRKPRLRMNLSRPAKVELFLSDYGTGVLSIMISPRAPEGCETFDVEALLDFNYLLSNTTRDSGVTLRLPHPKDDPRLWQGIPEEARRKIEDPPEEGQPLMERLGKIGMHFDLRELVEGDARLRPVDLKDAEKFVRQVLDAKDAMSSCLLKNPFLRRKLEDAAHVVTPDLAEVTDALNRVLRHDRPLVSEESFRHIKLTETMNRSVSRHPRGAACVRLNRALLEEAYPGCFQKYQSSNLLTPLERYDLVRAQDRLSVYTVVRFSSSVDFDQPDTCAYLAPLLSALAQVEEPSHALVPAGKLLIANEILNRQHWVATGLLGAAHLIADQPGGIAFNEQRAWRMLHKYFIPFLMAMSQRLMLQRLMVQAAVVAMDPQRPTAEGVAQLRLQLLDFEVLGHFPQISSREVLHRYYRLCQNGQDINHLMDAMRRGFTEIDGRLTEDRRNKVALDTQQSIETQNQIARDTRTSIETQNKIAEDTRENLQATAAIQNTMSQHLETVSSVQRRLEVIEVAVCSVYFAEMVDMILNSGKEHKAWIIGAALFGIVFALLILRPWSHRKTGSQYHTTGG